MLGNREEKEKAAMNLAAEYRHVASLFNGLKTVLTAFNGKVYNKRIETALRGIYEGETGFIHMEHRQGYAGISIYMRGRGYTLVYGKKEDLLTEDNRIKADAWIERAAEKRAEHLKKAFDIEQALPYVGDVAGKIEQLKKAIGALQASLPWEVRDIYNI